MTAPSKANHTIALRRIIAAMKGTRKNKGGPKGQQNWISGKHDQSAYFQTGLAELERCKEEGLLG